MKFAAENPVVQEILIAGLKPLPINRMLRQAGRKVNRDRIENASQVYSSPMTPKQRQEGMERLIRAQDAINSFDPIEASATEDMNRLRGGRRGPVLPGAADFLMDLQTIPTPSNPDGVGLFGSV